MFITQRYHIQGGKRAENSFSMNNQLLGSIREEVERGHPYVTPKNTPIFYRFQACVGFSG